MEMRSGEMLATASLGGALMLFGWAGQAAQPYTARPVDRAGSTAKTFEEDAQASLFGELRTTLADYLLLKADRTHHRGVAMRGLTESEKARMTGEERHSPPGHDGREHIDETTVVPTRQTDWRGLLGEVHRQVAPVFDIRRHKHGSIQQTAALYWLAVKASPHMVSGYVLGAYVIRAGGKDYDQALRMLREGERLNPDSVEIQTEIGHDLFLYKHQNVEAERHLRQALSLAGKRQFLMPDEAEARGSAYRWLARLYARTHRPREAVRVAREGQAVMGPDPVLQRVTREEGHRG